MKISLQWIKEFTQIKCSTDELIKKIGAQLGEVEEVIDLGERYKNIVVAKIVSCEKHPNADKLSVCKIDDGKVIKGVKRDTDGNVQVVCGAPNVRKNLTVAWIPPKAVVPSTFDKDQFTLEARKIRGVVSNGMLASPQELAISDDHDGILVLDKKASPGDWLADIYKLNDTIIDIENKMFTHRPDCFGILGVAREIAGIQQIGFKSPQWYLSELDTWDLERGLLPLEVSNKATKLVPRFMAVVMRDVTVGKSPIMIQSFLSRVGIKPINNIVDITNFTMVLTGQPMHAYDYDKVHALSKKSASIVVRSAKRGETVKVLGGKTITFEDESIVIATDKTIIGVGGVIGAENTEVDATTTSIILECANFNMYAIRRTSMKYGLFTDAVTRFNKGQSPLQNDNTLSYAVTWVKKLAGGGIAGPLHDIKHLAGYAKTDGYSVHAPVKVSVKFIESRLGVMLGAAFVKKLLQNVEFSASGSGDQLTVTAPFWRTDIAIAEDIVEEIGRLRGLDTLPAVMQKKAGLPPSANVSLELQQNIRNILASAGAHEVLTYSFVHGNVITKANQDEQRAFRLTNAISPDLQYYRLSILPSLLQKIQSNLRSDYPRIDDELALFEINKISNKKEIAADTLPLERNMLGFVFAAGPKTANQKYSGAPYYIARRYAAHLFEMIDRGLPELLPLKQYLAKHKAKDYMLPFDPDRSAVLKFDNAIIGVLGEFKAPVAQAFKLPSYCAGFEIDIEAFNKPASFTYASLAKYPRVQQDITLSVKNDTPLIEIEDTIWSAITAASNKKKNAQDKTELESCSVVDIYQSKENTNLKNVTFRLWLRNNQRTLTTEETNNLLDAVADNAKALLGARRI